MVRRDPKRLALRWVWVGCMALFYELFLTGVFFRFLAILVRFWEVLGSPNGSKNRILRGFLRCFFRVRLGIDFLVFFYYFFRVRTLIFVRTASVLEHFHKIDGFFKSSKKTLILAPFSEVKTVKNREQILLKNMFFLNIEF